MTSKIKFVALPLVALAIGFGASAQRSTVPNGWHLTDQKTSGYYGISLDQAYQFLKGKKSTEVVVAVIDSGIDTLHEDLKPVMWTNKREIPGNGVDDDKNGYTDDVHGWNFLGGKDGRNVGKDSYEAARIYHKYKARFEGISDPATLPVADRELYTMWAKAKGDISNGADLNTVNLLKRLLPDARKGDSALAAQVGKKTYSANDADKVSPSAMNAIFFKNMLTSFAKDNGNMDATNEDLFKALEGEISKGDNASEAPKNYRGDVVKDNEADINDRYYGNNDIMATGADHGTHVSGIIAAARNNKKGVDGVADNVRIMTVRAVPDGDEHDKDIALAIRYAADNGAKVINMSFGKGVSPEKAWVDDAVKYAQSKGVLLVHAAGNDGSNVDTTWNFPTPVFKGSDYKATNWLTVGASGAEKNSLVATFSNYGKKEVDVFAPGVNIYSSVPGGNNYSNFSGTSMASPVVAGLAALILQYYPKLSPEQVKLVIEQSAVPLAGNVTQPRTGEELPLAELSKTGGVVNAYEAVRMADELSRTGKVVSADKKIKIDGKGTKVKTPTQKTKVKVKAV